MTTDMTMTAEQATARIEKELESFHPSLVPVIRYLHEAYGVTDCREWIQHRDPLMGEPAFWEYNFDLLCSILADLGEL